MILFILVFFRLAFPLYPREIFSSSLHFLVERVIFYQRFVPYFVDNVDVDVVAFIVFLSTELPSVVAGVVEVPLFTRKRLMCVTFLHDRRAQLTLLRQAIVHLIVKISPHQLLE